MPAAKAIAPEHYAVLARVVKTGECWEWDGYHNQYGYAVFQGRAGAQRRAAHRLVYGYYFGCVNPHHMRTVTPKQNTEHFVTEVRSSNTSGHRGVTYDKARRRWRARVASGSKVRASYHLSVEDAADAARRMRLEMHTHNDLDRMLIVRGV